MSKNRHQKTTKLIKRQSHPKHFLKVYAPYLPIFIIVMSSFLAGVLPKSGFYFGASSSRGSNSQSISGNVLAYATDMSISGLLSATNAQRTSNGLQSLTLNTKLNNSAQSKANDMISKDYWAHNSPNGDEPWVFFDAAGYNYQKAGENLAYGFSTSSDTIVGWMNSASHRANMLDTQYTEVGFGYSNSSNFVSTGEETIVVAHYAKPTVTATTAQETVDSSKTIKNSQSAVKNASNTSETTPAPPAEAAEETQESETTTLLSADRINQPYNNETSDEKLDSKPQNITLLQKITNGNAPWSAGLITLVTSIIILLWLSKHAYNIKKIVSDGEHFVMHHPMIDVAVVVFVALATVLSQTSGVIL